MKLKMKGLLKQTEFYVFCIIVAFALIIQVRSGLFFTSNNLMDLVRSMIIPGIYAICALLSFVSTGADVSFPLIAALSAYIAVTLGNRFSLGVIPIFAIAIVVGCLIGCINGFFIVKYKFNSLIVTLGTSSICSGILFGTFEAGRTELPEKLYALSKINLVIAAVVLGGTRMIGGIGTLRGCLLGTLLLTMVSNSLILLGISVYWEKVFIGAIIIIGTAVSAMQAMRASRTSAKKKGAA